MTTLYEMDVHHSFASFGRPPYQRQHQTIDAEAFHQILDIFQEDRFENDFIAPGGAAPLRPPKPTKWEISASGNAKTYGIPEGDDNRQPWKLQAITEDFSGDTMASTADNHSGQEEGMDDASGQAPTRKTKPCKSRRAHYKRVVENAQRLVASAPDHFDPDVISLSLPRYILTDAKLHCKFMHGLQNFHQGLLDGSREAPPLITANPQVLSSDGRKMQSLESASYPITVSL